MLFKCQKRSTWKHCDILNHGSLKKLF
ncbi:unnamed protein product [Spirodela intermedia]|uniref:Uncharacterized protein n=1 Tax=Spirodela intermedia TaxID=51605 RepID=A0A7I8KYS5_SPIIN|nr:unnamed protein product [Spirodela intermedia]